MTDSPEKPPARRRRAIGDKTANIPKVQLGPADWVGAAFDMLVTDNIDAVRVDVLAKRLNVTRGSFYWHFADREDLLERVLEQWRRTTTERVIERFSSGGLGARDMLRELLRLPFHGKAAANASAVEMAIREWGRRSDDVRRVLAEVDNQRLGYISQCFSALGRSIPEARNCAALFYAAMLSEAMLQHVLPEGQREERVTFIAAAVIDRPGGDAPGRSA